jgi:2-dehydro-3-deoxy-D-gluconate 5-dehydrogenase
VTDPDARARYLDALFGLEGRAAIVTGASRGLGAAMAIALARAGARVCLVGRSDNLGDTAAAIALAGGEAAEVVGDLTTEEGVDAIVGACVGRFGSVDIVVNNAGTFIRKPALEWSMEEFDEVVDLSLRSVFMMCQRAGREMLERGRGKIVNIGSVLSFQGGYTVPGYAASRHGLVGLTRALANEWAGRGVHVNAIAPGYVDTDLLAGLKQDPERSRALLARVPAGRWGYADELAGAVIYLASAASDFVHGETLVVDGGWMSR